MTMAVDIVLAMVLAVAGYVYTCYYFNHIKWNTYNRAALKLTRNKVLYLAAVAASVITLIVLFETVYELDAISQVKLLSLAMILYPIAAVDSRDMKIPNQLLIAAILIRILIYLVEFISSASTAFAILKNDLIGALVIGVFFFVFSLLSKNSLGMGDVKLFAVMGLYQGLWGVINSLCFTCIVSFVLAVGLLVVKKKGWKDSISFGPCILVGTMVAMGLAGM